jgi:hypothetical protein
MEGEYTHRKSRAQRYYDIPSPPITRTRIVDTQFFGVLKLNNRGNVPSRNEQ